MFPTLLSIYLLIWTWQLGIQAHWQMPQIRGVNKILLGQEVNIHVGPETTLSSNRSSENPSVSLSTAKADERRIASNTTQHNAVDFFEQEHVIWFDLGSVRIPSKCVPCQFKLSCTSPYNNKKRQNDHDESYTRLVTSLGWSSFNWC